MQKSEEDFFKMKMALQIDTSCVTQMVTKSACIFHLASSMNNELINNYLLLDAFIAINTSTRPETP